MKSFLLSVLLFLVFSPACFSDEQSALAAKDAALLTKSSANYSRNAGYDQYNVAASAKTAMNAARLACTDPVALAAGDVYKDAGESSYDEAAVIYLPIGDLYVSNGNDHLVTGTNALNAGNYPLAEYHFNQASERYAHAHEDFDTAYYKGLDAECSFEAATSCYAPEGGMAP